MFYHVLQIGNEPMFFIFESLGNKCKFPIFQYTKYCFVFAIEKKDYSFSVLNLL